MRAELNRIDRRGSVPGAARRGLPSPATLAVVCLVGQMCFVLTASLLPRVSEYSFTGDTISELAIGRYGWLQTMAFFATGIGTIALASGLRATLGRERGARLGTTLLGFYGTGALIAGVFPTDAVDATGQIQSLSISGTIHIATAILSFLFAIASILILARVFRRIPQWQTLWPWSLVLGLAAAISFFLQNQGPTAGLRERFFIGTITLWLCCVAIRLYRHDRAAPSTISESPRSEA